MFKDTVAIQENILPASEKITFRPRFDSIDILRGIVIVLMALDHVRHYFTNVYFNPLDLEQTSIQLFLTRWITHFCAPVFVFLAGTGAFLSMGRGRSKSDVTKYLLSRGLWLIFLELTVIKAGWTFGFDFSSVDVAVIWAIGCSMIFLALLIHLPLKAIAAISIVMILTHNLFDGITPEEFGSFSWLWIILHNFDGIEFGSGYSLFVAYPLIPWIGVMAAGYCFGALYNLEEYKRKKILLWLGMGMTAGFILVRLFDFYGDFNRWTEQRNFIFTLFDFIDTTKYPPSLLFLLMTLGPSILSLYFLEKVKGEKKLLKFFTVFGRVPLFFYLLHIPLIHLLAVLTAFAAGFDTSFMFNQYPFGWDEGLGWGFSLPVVYLVWFVVVAGLYPVCYWYYNLKRRKKSKLLSYL